MTGHTQPTFNPYSRAIHLAHLALPTPGLAFQPHGSLQDRPSIGRESIPPNLPAPPKKRSCSPPWLLRNNIIVLRSLTPSSFRRDSSSTCLADPRPRRTVTPTSSAGRTLSFPPSESLVCWIPDSGPIPDDRFRIASSTPAEDIQAGDTRTGDIRAEDIRAEDIRAEATRV